MIFEADEPRAFERANRCFELEARIDAYEMAAKLQLSAPEVADLSQELKSTTQLYQLDHQILGDFGRQCLMARRLSERGVEICSDLLWCRKYYGGTDTSQLTAMKIYHEIMGTGVRYWTRGRRLFLRI